MISIKEFTFGPFQENTYLLYDETGECVIIDPGCYDDNERKLLSNSIENRKLNPKLLLNTHCHIDHVVGNKYVSEKYGLKPIIHLKDLAVLNSLTNVGRVYNLNVEASPEPGGYLEEGDVVNFGKSKLDVVFTPGHSPGSMCFICHEQKFVIGGDVLFYRSIGRTDLPGGHHQTLLDSIKNKLLVLPDEYEVHSGHGPTTSIGFERMNNPFLVA